MKKITIILKKEEVGYMNYAEVRIARSLGIKLGTNDKELTGFLRKKKDLETLIQEDLIELIDKNDEEDFSDLIL